MIATFESAREKIKANSPKEPFALDFDRVSTEALRCKCCGQFTVGRYRFEGATLYSVWFKAVGSQALQLRMNLTSPDDAKTWASAIASAYKKGTITLKAPPTKAEIDAQKLEIERLRQTA